MIYKKIEMMMEQEVTTLIAKLFKGKNGTGILKIYNAGKLDNGLVFDIINLDDDDFKYISDFAKTMLNSYSKGKEISVISYIGGDTDESNVEQLITMLRDMGKFKNEDINTIEKFINSQTKLL